MLDHQDGARVDRQLLREVVSAPHLFDIVPVRTGNHRSLPDSAVSINSRKSTAFVPTDVYTVSGETAARLAIMAIVVDA